jgi:endonuclease YncB( thermonuclease family)
MRSLRSLFAMAIIALGVLIAAMLNRKPEEMITGAARVIDGDSLVINGREMRIRGIDAPEARQTCTVSGKPVNCGREAAAALRRWIARGPAACSGNEIDRYGRLLVVCRINGTDIGADLVRNGFALDFGDYPNEEREARAQYRGVWAGEFERPAEYRRRQREQPPAP